MKVVVLIAYPYRGGRISRYSNNDVRAQYKDNIKWFLRDINEIKAKRFITQCTKKITNFNKG
jgi:hypothetical protein